MPHRLDRPLRVLRLTPGYEPPPSALTAGAVRFNPVGGVQNHAAQLTRALDRRGVRQTVISTRPPTAPVVARDGEHARIVRLGLPTPRWRQLYAPQAAPLALLLGLARRVDVVHVHFSADLGIVPVAALAALVGRARLVVTVHCSLRHTLVIDSEHARRLRDRGGPVEEWVTRRADAVIVLTRRLAGALVADGLPGHRVHVIPSGVDPAAYQTSADAPDPLAAVPHPRITYVGRLEPEKDVRTVVGALPLLRARDAQLVLVGDGAQRTNLLDEARRLGVAHRVHAIGFVHHDEIPAVLAASDAFVLPSRFEEMGTAMVEAMHAGLAVVASAVGGIPSVVTDQVSGLLVPPGEPAAFAAALDRVLGDLALASRLGEGARRAVAGFAWPALADQVLAVYRSAAAPG